MQFSNCCMMRNFRYLLLPKPPTRRIGILSPSSRFPTASICSLRRMSTILTTGSNTSFRSSAVTARVPLANPSEGLSGMSGSTIVCSAQQHQTFRRKQQTDPLCYIRYPLHRTMVLSGNDLVLYNRSRIGKHTASLNSFSIFLKLVNSPLCRWPTHILHVLLCKWPDLPLDELEKAAIEHDRTAEITFTHSGFFDSQSRIECCNTVCCKVLVC
jgi:hypothetical protein